MCPVNSHCQDLPYGYECICNNHYINDGVKSCKPKNYCEDPNICPLYANCIQTLPTGYKCECRPGFKSVNEKCIPKDPCVTKNGGCSINASCMSSIIGKRSIHSHE